MATSTTTLFNAKSGNQQGLATNGHYTWLSYDVGGGLARIETYIWNGRYVGVSPALPLGHAAELDFRVANGNLYVANGGLQSEATGSDTKVFEVSLSAGIAQKITRTYDFTYLGHNGMVAVDNINDRLLVIGGPDVGPWKLVTMPFSTGVKSSPLTITDPHIVLQGLAVVKGALWLYVSDQATTSTAKARIDVFKLVSGVLMSKNRLSFTGEAEGMAVNPLTGSVYIGAHSPNRVMRVSVT
jgi:hypothetical protein